MVIQARRVEDLILVYKCVVTPLFLATDTYRRAMKNRNRNSQSHRNIVDEICMTQMESLFCGSEFRIIAKGTKTLHLEYYQEVIRQTWNNMRCWKYQQELEIQIQYTRERQI